MCWQSPDSLSYNVGMGPVDSGFFKVEAGSGHHGFLKNQTVQVRGRIARGIVLI